MPSGEANYKLVKGDMFATPGLGALAHGCNTHGFMNAGLARSMRLKYPEMYDEYKDMCHRGLFKLDDVYRYWDKTGIYIFNLATQNAPGPNADLASVGNTVWEALRQCKWLGVATLGLPLVGSGIGGLDRDEVLEVLLQCSRGNPDTQLVIFEEFIEGVNVNV